MNNTNSNDNWRNDRLVFGNKDTKPYKDAIIEKFNSLSERNRIIVRATLKDPNFCK